MQDMLIYDVGAHRGEDTDFYLKKGFRVLAIEADPILCASIRARFTPEIRDGRLVLLNIAIAKEDGPLIFYRNLDTSVWGTIMLTWKSRNQRAGTVSVPITVEGCRFTSILTEYGTPYYLKIDIEGADLFCLEGLLEKNERPRYLSIESDKVSWRRLNREFELLEALGYSRFKVVPQHKVSKQKCPFPASEGHYIPYRFEEGSSGLFGSEVPGRWYTSTSARLIYLAIFLQYRLLGDSGIFTRYLPWRQLARALCIRRQWYEALGPGWYDTHAS